MATQITSERTITLHADGAASHFALYNQSDYRYKEERRASILGIKLGSSMSEDAVLIKTPATSAYHANDTITSFSHGDTLLQGTRFTAPNGTTLEAGTVSEPAKLILEGVRTTIITSHTQESSHVVWQSSSGVGGTTETFALPSFAGGATFKATGGLEVQVPDGDFTTEINKLASQPGMGYLNELAGRSDIDWQKVKLAHDHWQYQQSGLTGAGAALLAAVVAYCTAGVGAGWVAGGTTTTAATAATAAVTTTTLTGVMANAALTSLASQASIALVNNKGDLGKTLSDLGKAETVKAALAAIATAGVMDKIGGMPGMQNLSKAGDWTFDKVSYNVINATGRSLTNAFITGGNLEDALKNGLIGAVVDTVHGGVAGKIKTMEVQTFEGYLPHKLAHGGAGCLAGAAVGGTCQDGAIGAAIGEMVAELMPPANGLVHSPAEREKVLLASKLTAGAAAAYSGGDAQTAMTTAETAVQNNALVPILIGLAWLADKAWTAYEVAEDVQKIRNGTPIKEIATKKGEDYIVGILLGNVAKHAGKAAGKAYEYVVSNPNLLDKIGQDVLDVVKKNRHSNTQFKIGANGGVTTIDAAVATGSPITTRFVNGVTVVDRQTGAVFNGTVDLQPTFDRIAAKAAGLSKNDGSVFRNGQALLPPKSPGYYTEYVVPTPGINGPGPQRIVTGQSGEMFYTPDHYVTFVPVKKP